MAEFLKNNSEIIALLATSAAVYFAYLQTKINKRLQDLEDYVAVSIVPRENFRLDIMNVGKINLYLHKWEAGVQTENFMEPVLIPAGTASFISILIKPEIGKKLVKFYLTDEFKRKFLSRGEISIEPVSVHPVSQMQPQIQQEIQTQGLPQTGVLNQPHIVNITANMRAWSYKTEKYNWEI